ncbi:MAG: FAD/NAD(P)-binding protein, partial [Terrimicrobiaceae bacterium]
MSRIAIIGAGLSGRLLALNLLRFASSDASVSIRMLDRGDERYMGPAYSYAADYLLLNVPAGRMGAFSEDPEHFLTWNRDRGAHAGPWDFLPRRLYRDYILALVCEALQARAGSTTFEQVRGEVTDIDTEGGCATIHVKDKGPIVVDKAVLALGNFPPRHPPIE